MVSSPLGGRTKANVAALLKRPLLLVSVNWKLWNASPPCIVPAGARFFDAVERISVRASSRVGSSFSAICSRPSHSSVNRARSPESAR
jgi:hypothetical protein